MSKWSSSTGGREQREVVPSAGIVDSQSVKAPARARERGYDAHKKIGGASATSLLIPKAGYWR
jgi:hypothetical protein